MLILFQKVYNLWVFNDVYPIITLLQTEKKKRFMRLLPNSSSNYHCDPIILRSKGKMYTQNVDITKISVIRFRRKKNILEDSKFYDRFFFS